MRVVIVGYYSCEHGFGGGAEALAKRGYVVDFFPLSAYVADHGVAETIDALVGFINNDVDVAKMHPKTIHNKIGHGGTLPTIILWWNNVGTLMDSLRGVREKTPNTRWIYYTWDVVQAQNTSERDNIYSVFDSCLTCSETDTFWYKLNGCRRAAYLAPGFDPKLHHPAATLNQEQEADKQRWECDVSLVCTNLYEHEHKDGGDDHINRAKLLDKLQEKQQELAKIGTELKVHLYGPAEFRDRYPTMYRGYANFEDLSKIYYWSHINICTHVSKRHSRYINERVCQILGSGGLLLVDATKDIKRVLDTDNECLIIDENDPVGQIMNVLKMYSNNEGRKRLDEIKHNGYQRALEYLTWDHWAKTVDSTIREIQPYAQPTEPAELFHLLCSLHGSSFNISKRLKLVEDYVNRSHVDINGFLLANIDAVIKHTNHS
jgi:hypothetical protein